MAGSAGGTTLISNGTVVNASGEERADVLIVDGRISAVGPRIAADRADEVVDAAGLLVLPGMVDSHTHLDAPGMGTVTRDDFDSGTRAALAGGTTAIVDFAFQEGTLRDGFASWLRKAEGRAHLDFGLHLVITDPRPEVLDELPGLIRDGVTSFKIFMTAADSRNLTSEDIATILRRLERTGGLLQVHAEDGAEIGRRIADLRERSPRSVASHIEARPVGTEVTAVDAVVEAVRVTGRPAFVVHVSSGAAAERIAAAQAAGLPILGETCIHYLVLTDDELRRPGFEAAKFVCAPPLRTAADQDALWAALAAGRLQICSSDHCPYDFVGQKDLGIDDFSKIPNGLPSIEHRFSLLWEYGVARGRLDASQLVRIASAEPARIFGLDGKGAVAPGFDADLLLFDPAGTTRISAATQHMAVDYTPFEGVECAGAIRRVISRGETVVLDGNVLTSPGRGRYLPRSVEPFPARAAAEPQTW